MYSFCRVKVISRTSQSQVNWQLRSRIWVLLRINNSAFSCLPQIRCFKGYATKTAIELVEYGLVVNQKSFRECAAVARLLAFPTLSFLTFSL